METLNITFVSQDLVGDAQEGDEEEEGVQPHEEQSNTPETDS